jgi:hypothetical protein
MIQSVAQQDPERLEGLTNEQKRVLVMVAGQSLATMQAAEMATAHALIESDVLNELESKGPSSDWNSFINRLQKFKQ